MPTLTTMRRRSLYVRSLPHRALRCISSSALLSAFPGYPARSFTNENPQGRGLIEGGGMDRWAKAKRQAREIKHRKPENKARAVRTMLAHALEALRHR